jgi:hypothetical protein
MVPSSKAHGLMLVGVHDMVPSIPEIHEHQGPILEDHWLRNLKFVGGQIKGRREHIDKQVGHGMITRAATFTSLFEPDLQATIGATSTTPRGDDIVVHRPR